MENLRIIKFVFILLGGMLLIVLAIPFFIFAYDDKTTHPALTDEIVDHFNRFEPDKALSISQKELVKQGSIDEDSGTRWLQHFYDPVKNRGLLLLGGQYQSSKDWSRDTLAQAGSVDDPMYGSIFAFFSARSDFSWDRAVYEYAWGDKNRAMLALGHVLHLLEDASVPDHTRNDPHPHVTEWFATLNESPYEIWTKKFTPNNFTASINASPVILGSLNEYFNSMAGYSNGNFFSKDTILRDYASPKISEEKDEILSDGQSYTFGYANNIRLVKIKKGTRWSAPEYSVVDNDDLILTDYWNHLSKQAILHGAGVMKLFFDEVAREQQTKTLYNKNRSWWQKIGDNIAGIWQSVAGGTTVSPSSSLATMIDVAPPAGNEVALDTTKIEVSPPAGGETSPPAQAEIPTELIALSLVSSEPVSVATPSVQDSPLVFVAGGAGPRRTIDNQQSTINNESLTPSDTTPPDAPVITAPTGTIQTTSRVTFSGTAEANAEIFQDFDTATTTVNESSAWSLALDLPQGTTTITFFAKDAAGNTSAGAAKIIFVDSEAPDVSLSIDECASSLSQNGCLIATTTLTLRWSSNAQDLVAYEVACAKDNAGICENFLYDQIATSVRFIAENNHTYIFTANARDTSGNESFITKTVEVRTTPVVINEIAWMGTASSSEDEWIELKNMSSQPINFGSAWVLKTDDDAPRIVLTGLIPANGYYLLERNDDATVSDIAADQLYGNDGPDWALNNTGEVLTLAYGSTTIDQTPALNSCGRRRWCAGDAASRASMERIDPLLDGTSVANWATNNGLIKTGKDAAGNPIVGTPKARNSANYDIERLWYAHGEPAILTLSNAVYIIGSSGFTIPIGKTLVVQPGAVIKFVSANEPSLWVSGTLKAEGTAENPVVFTSIYDDAYGGDTNGDGVCNPEDASSTAICPFPGAWKQIYISPDSTNTILNHAIIRYGGRWFNNMSFRSMLAVDRAKINLTNSVIEHSWGYGLYAANSDSTIEDNIFRNHRRQNDDFGFLIGGGNPTMRRNASSYNSVGGKNLAAGDLLSLSLGSDGMPFVMYRETTNNDLQIAQCLNTTCSATTTVALDGPISGAGGTVGRAVSAMLNQEGKPTAAYYEENASYLDLRLTNCWARQCADATTSAFWVDGATSDGGEYASLALGADGNPLIASRDGTLGDLRLALCKNASCTSTSSTLLIDGKDDTNGGYFASLAIGIDGNPIVAHRDGTLGDLRLARCLNASCTATTTTAVDGIKADGSQYDAGAYASLALAPDGNPLIAHYESDNNQDLRLAVCHSLDCTTSYPSMSTSTAQATTSPYWFFDQQEYDYASTSDDIRATTTGLNARLVQQFSHASSTNTDDIGIVWEGSVSGVDGSGVRYGTTTTLEIYNFSGGYWEILATGTALTGLDYTLQATTTGTASNYYNGGNRVVARVVTATTSATTTMSLATDFINISFGAATASLKQRHYRWRNDDGSETGASWGAAEDTALSSGVYPGDRRRLRFSVSNANAAASNITYRLEYASSTCATPYEYIPVKTSYDSSQPEWIMDPSYYMSEEGATTAQLSVPAGKSFVAGYAKQSSNQTSAHSLTASQYSEFEYAVKSTVKAQTSLTYCFRLTNAGTTLTTYSVTPSITISSAARPQTGGGGGEGAGSGSQTSGGAGQGAGAGGEGSGSGGQTGGGTGQGGGGGSQEFVPWLMPWFGYLLDFSPSLL